MHEAITSSALPQVPEKNLAPQNGTLERYRAQEILCFLSTEVHKQFPPLLMKFDEESQKRAKDALTKAFAHLDSLLSGGKKFFLGEKLSIVDAYVYNMLLWSKKVELGVLEKHENLKKFFDNMEQQEAVQSALKQEGLK
jgi:glutathione S-transferase